jgi:hypothetical protein
MKRLIYLLLPVCMAAACGDAPELKEEGTPVEETVKEGSDEPSEDLTSEPETVKDAFSDVTPEMVVAFKRFRDAMVNKDAVRLGSMMEDRLENGCAYEGERTVDAAGVIGLLDEAQLEVLKKRIETTVNTDTKMDGCIYKDMFAVDDDKQGFSWSVGCIQLLEEEIGEYNTIFQFRKVNGKYRLTGVMCAG